MDIDATLLGPRSPFTARSFRSLASPPRSVGFSFIPVIAYFLTYHFIVSSELPAWKQLITRTLTTSERISLITTILLDRDQVEMVGHLSGDDAQTFIDTVYEVRFRAPPPPMNGWSPPPTHTCTPCWLGVGRPRTTHPQEVHPCCVQALRPPGPGPAITDDSASLQPNEGPAVP